MLTAGEFCNRHVVIGHEEERVTEIAQRMREHHVGAVIIVKEGGLGRVPVGIITDRDIVVGLVAVEPSYLESALVRDLLPSKLITIREDADLSEVVVRMRSHGIRRIPVVNGSGHLQGLIAMDDLLDHIGEELRRLSSLFEREADRERRERPSLSTSH